MKCVGGCKPKLIPLLLQEALSGMSAIMLLFSSRSDAASPGGYSRLQFKVMEHWPSHRLVERTPLNFKWVLVVAVK